MSRKAEQREAVSTEGSGKKRGIGRGKHPNSRNGSANLRPWPKGKSGNPGGLPGTDLSAVYARRFFERHPGRHRSGLWRVSSKDSMPTLLCVLADRGYGKVKDRHEITGGRWRAPWQSRLQAGQGSAMATTECIAEFPAKLEFLFEQHRYKVVKGGRYGLKSWNFARARC